jgi:putative oxidoreductase
MKTDIRTFDLSLLLLRIIVGIVILGHGAQKVLGWFGGFGFDGTIQFFTVVIGLPYFLSLLIIMAETLGMIALILGLLSRLISGSLIVIMVGAIATTHAANGFFMNWAGSQAGEGFEFHLLVIAMSSVILLNGAGSFSLDHFLLKQIRHKQNASSKA